jgi:hypothetical protein
LPVDGAGFRFLEGSYVLRVFAKRLVDNKPRQLCEIQLHLSPQHAIELEDEDTGLYFDWGPDQQAYRPHIDLRVPKMPGPGFFS